MNPIRRELLNGLFVLVVASLMSAAFEAFQVSFNVQLWVWIVIGVAIAVSGYVVFEITLGYMASTAESTRQREEEWLKRVGNPARLELNREGKPAGIAAAVEALKTMRTGSDLTFMYYYGPDGGGEVLGDGEEVNAVRGTLYNLILEELKRGRIRDFKRIICIDRDVLANDHELQSGVLRVGTGPGTIDPMMGRHCRAMMETNGCSLFVAPAVFRTVVVLYGLDMVSMNVETAENNARRRTFAGVLFFSDPPNGEIVEQFRQIERATERHMVAVHKIVFPEDTAAMAQTARR